MPNTSLEYSPSQAALTSLAAGTGAWGGIQALNTLDLAFGLPHKLKNVNKAINELEQLAKSRKQKDLSLAAKAILKEKGSVESIYKLRDALEAAINSPKKDLLGGITQQGHSILHNNLLGNRLTERIINNSLREKIFPSKVNAVMGNFCPIGRRAILAGTLALLGASLGGLRKKTASSDSSNYDISYSIPQAIGVGGATGTVGLSSVLLSNEIGKRKLLKDLSDKAKSRSISNKDYNKLLHLLRQKYGLYTSDITGYGAEEVRKSLPYEKLSKKFNDKVRTILGFTSPKTNLPIKAKNKFIEGILKRTTPLTTLIGISTLLGGLSFNKKASSTYSFDPENAVKGFALGAGGTAMANEIIGDYIPAVAAYNKFDKIYVPDLLVYPFSIDPKSGKLNIDMQAFRNLSRKAKLYNSLMHSKDLNEIAKAKSKNDAKKIFYKYFNLSDKELKQLKKRIKASDFISDYFKGDYGVLNPIKNIVSRNKDKNIIVNKLNNLIKNPNNLESKSYAQQFFNPKYMKLKNKLVYLMGILGAAGFGLNKFKDKS